MTDAAPVTAIDPDIHPANIVDNANDHTPEPVTPPVVADAPDPPRSDKEGLGELQTIAASLAKTAEILTGAIAQLADNVVNQTRDDSPTTLPWTHRGGSHESDD